MNDAEYRKQKLRIQALADKWLAALGLKWWRVQLVYSREPLATEGAPAWTCNAYTSVKWEYLNAKITFNMLELPGMEDAEIERIFVHECCHILVNEMRMWGPSTMDSEKMDEAMKHEERVVCGITAALLWTRKDGEKALARARTKTRRR